MSENLENKLGDKYQENGYQPKEPDKRPTPPSGVSGGKPTEKTGEKDK